MTTQSENRTFLGRRSGTSRTAATPLPCQDANAGRYTDTDTLIRGNASRGARAGSYTDVESLTRPQPGVVRPGSYTDVDAPLATVSPLRRAGSYTDTDLNAA